MDLKRLQADLEELLKRVRRALNQVVAGGYNERLDFSS